MCWFVRNPNSPVNPLPPVWKHHVSGESITFWEAGGFVTLCAFSGSRGGCCIRGARLDLSWAGPWGQAGAVPTTTASSYPCQVRGLRALVCCLHTRHPCFKGCSAKCMEKTPRSVNRAISRADGFWKEVPKSGKIEFPTWFSSDSLKRLFKSELFWKGRLPRGANSAREKAEPTDGDLAVPVWRPSGGCGEGVQHWASAALKCFFSHIGISLAWNEEYWGQTFPKMLSPPLCHSLCFIHQGGMELIMAAFSHSSPLSHQHRFQPSPECKGSGWDKTLTVCAPKEVTFVEHTAVQDGSLRPWEMWNELNSGSRFQGKMKKN